jgi:hypothetical protein
MKRPRREVVDWGIAIQCTTMAGSAYDMLAEDCAALIRSARESSVGGAKGGPGVRRLRSAKGEVVGVSSHGGPHRVDSQGHPFGESRPLSVVESHAGASKTPVFSEFL